MTRMIKVDHEYRIVAVATQSTSIDRTIFAPDEEAAEEMFFELVDAGEFNSIFQAQKPSVPEVTDWEIEKVGTMQER